MTVMAANENSHGSQQQPWIGTHDGKFHCDEVFACYMLKKLPRFSGHIILRTRDPSILAKCDIVVDVGAVYDHQRMRYDHHQRGFTETMNTITGIDYHTKLSSAGLIYAHYGKEVIAKIVGDEKANENSAHEKMYVTLYKTFIEAIDAIDNGIQQFDGIPRYQLSSTLTSRVESCNPAWNEKQPNPDEGFNRAKQIVGDEFEQHVRYMYNAWLPARQLVVTAIEIRKKVHSSGKILLFESGSAPWKQHFFELEKEMGLQEEDICLAVYQDQGGSWRVQAIPVSETSGFENRLSLPWKGFRDKDLEAESGITGAFFVHMSGFIGGAKTREGALKMAEEGLRHAGKWTETAE